MMHLQIINFICLFILQYMICQNYKLCRSLIFIYTIKHMDLRAKHTCKDTFKAHCHAK